MCYIFNQYIPYIYFLLFSFKCEYDFHDSEFWFSIMSFDMLSNLFRSESG